MRSLLVALPFLFAVPAHAGDDWPQFRGPHGDGHAGLVDLPTTWGGFSVRPAWKASIPGTGWSSPIVVNDHVWVTSAEQTALTAKALADKLADHPYGDLLQAHASIDLMATEIDAESGKVLRTLNLFTRENPSPIHLTNTYASPTPVTDGERLYCHFGSLGTVAVSLKMGKVVWQRRFQVDDISGPGSSPVIWKDRLILTRDGADQQFVVALDCRTGDIIWKTARPRIDAEEGRHRRAFSTPLVVHHKGRPQVVAPSAQWVVAYNPANGEEIWKVNFGTGHAVVPRPVASNGLVYVTSGYTHPELWAVRVDGTGDVTETHIAWKYDKQVPLISSPIVVDGSIYFVSPLGVLTCLDAATGELLWRERLQGNFAASPLAANGNLYFSNQAGITTVIRPGHEYNEIKKNSLIGRTMASFAVAGESLLIRVDSGLYCIRK